MTIESRRADPLEMLIYVSASRQMLTHEHVDALVAQSASNNLRPNVTGILIQDSLHFMQLLEGPATSVRALWERIKRDERHDIIRVITHTQIASRQCPDWAMRCYRTVHDERGFFAKDAYTSQTPVPIGKVTSPTVAQFLIRSASKLLK